jgi:hypothetical protein
VLGIPYDVLLPFSLGFSMARKFNDDRVEFLLKIALLIAPGILPSSRSMDEENCFSPF